MTLDNKTLSMALSLSAEVKKLSQKLEQAKIDYHKAVRQMYLSGWSMRQIANKLDISHQRVYQIIDSAAAQGEWTQGVSEATACSFCGTTHANRSLLVFGPGVTICSKCIAVCDKVLASGRQEKSGDVYLQPLALPNEARCSFCRKKSNTTGQLIAGRDERICPQCLDMSKAILEQQRNQ
jgi:hypothetical protein